MRVLAAAAPAMFVLIWATGFIVARLVAPHADAFAFLLVRFSLAAVLLAGAAAVARAPWPAGWRGWRDAALAGTALHGVYLGAVFWAVAHGLPAGVAALIAGSQPLVTATIAGPLLGERVAGRQWIGIALGLLGVAAVLAPRLGTDQPIPLVTVGVAMVGTLAIAAGTIWQKRTGALADLRSGTAIQYAAAALVVGIGVAVTGDTRFDPAPALLVGLGWSVLGLSIGAIGLLLWMLRRGAVVGVASLMFLVPLVTAAMGFVLFDEQLTPVQVAGMAMAVIGVAATARR